MTELQSTRTGHRSRGKNSGGLLGHTRACSFPDSSLRFRGATERETEELTGGGSTPAEGESVEHIDGGVFNEQSKKRAHTFTPG